MASITIEQPRVYADNINIGVSTTLPAAVQEDVSDGAEYGDTPYAWVWGEEYSDTTSDGFKYGETIGFLPYAMHAWLTEIPQLNATANQFAQLYYLVTNGTKNSDKVFIRVDETTADNQLFGDTAAFDLDIIIRAVETIVYGNPITYQLTAIQTIAVSMLFEDLLDSAFREYLAEGYNLGDILTLRYQAILNALDGLLFSDTPDYAKLFVANTSDSIEYIDTTINTAELFQQLTDGVSWFGSLGLDGKDFIVYALNTQTSGVSKYDNYPFNSMYGNYAAAYDGIYELEGSDDAGTAIQSVIRTGLMNFGTSMLKQVVYAYLGLAADGRMVMKTVAADRGNKKERWYEFRPRNDAFDTTRVKFGRGITSRYWQFELINLDGTDFELESIELLPIALNRRVM